MWLGTILLIYFADSLLFFTAALSGRSWQLQVARGVGVGGTLGLLAYLVRRGLIANRLPLTNTYETLVLFALLLMIVYMVMNTRYHLPALGGFASLLAALILSFCSLLSPEIEPLLPSLKSNWLLIHVLTAFLGYSAFGLAAASAAAYLVVDLAGRMAPGIRTRIDRNDTLLFLDWFTHRAIAFGYPLLTLAICIGAIWANACWGRYWNWDPKETWAFITWLFYAACLHMRYAGMSGRLFNGFAVLSFASVMFTYFGVNYWLASLHAYA